MAAFNEILDYELSILARDLEANFLPSPYRLEIIEKMMESAIRQEQKELQSSDNN